MRFAADTWGTAFPMIKVQHLPIAPAERATTHRRARAGLLAGDAPMALKLRRDVDCGQARPGSITNDASDLHPHHATTDVPARWQPKNNWRPGCPMTDDPVLHVQSALEQVERKMKNLKALLGEQSAPQDDGHRVA